MELTTKSVTFQVLETIISLLKILPQAILDFGEYKPDDSQKDLIFWNDREFQSFCVGYFVACGLNKKDSELAKDIIFCLDLSYGLGPQWDSENQKYFFVFDKTELLIQLLKTNKPNS